MRSVFDDTIEASRNDLFFWKLPTPNFAEQLSIETEQGSNQTIGLDHHEPNMQDRHAGQDTIKQTGRISMKGEEVQFPHDPDVTVPARYPSEAPATGDSRSLPSVFRRRV
jgi:hypothetical protein